MMRKILIRAAGALRWIVDYDAPIQ